MCEFLVDLVGLRHKLRQHGVGLCIQGGGVGFVGHQPGVDGDIEPGGLQGGLAEQCGACLLYTSDAADEEDSGDLGGRRIIEKKKNEEQD